MASANKYTASLVFALVLAQFAFSQEIVSSRIKTVVIDAGHGGKDPGAIGKNSQEKNITLGVASKLRDLLYAQHPDLKVVMTREDDVFVKLIDRADIANKNKADLFISIHVNSNHKKEVSGVEFWVQGLHKQGENLEVAKAENDVLNLEEGDIKTIYGIDPSSSEFNIIMAMKQNLHLDNSINFAKAIEKNYTVESNQINRGTKQAGFVVLYKTTMPSVLVEIGFLTNSTEEAYINSEEGQMDIAQKLTAAFTEYKIKYEAAADKANKAKEAVKANVKKQDESAKPKIEAKKPVEEKPVINRRLVILDDELASISKTPEKVESPKVAEKAPAEAPKVVAEQVSVKTEPQFNTPTKPQAAASKPAVESPKKPKSDPKKTGPTSESLLNKADKKVITLEDEVSEAAIKSPKVNNDNTVSGTSTEKVSNEYSGVSQAATSSNVIINTPEAPKPIKKTVKESEPEAPKATTESTPEPSFKRSEDVKKAILENAKELAAQSPVSPAPAAPSAVKSPSATKAISKVSKGIVYRVQIKASATPHPMDNSTWQNLGDIEESKEDGLYKYLIGEYTSMEEARQKQAEIKSAGISDAFVVKYQNGARVKN